jgi:hypothetical protein
MIGALVLCTIGFGFPRKRYSDKEVVSRADLIILAKLKEGSIVFLPNERDPSVPRAWRDPSSAEYHWPGGNHRLDLFVTKVLKGAVPTNPLSIYIVGGLQPVVGGYSSNGLGGPVVSFTYTNYPKDMVQLFDITTTAKSSSDLFTGDIRTNHFWLLHAHQPVHANPQIKGMTNRLWIVDPEDVQLIDKEERLIEILRSASSTNGQH